MSQRLSFSKDKIRVVLFEGIHPHAEAVFREHGYTNVERIDGALDQASLISRIQDAHMIGIRSRTKLTAEVLESAPKLMAIGCFCIGTNQVDLAAATARGIAVFNAPHSNTRSVAELVIGLTIMLLRNIFPRSVAAHEKRWEKTAKGSFEVRGKTLGIVGYGHIGSQVSVLAESMGMKVHYFDTSSKLPLGNAHAVGTLDELLSTSDVVTLHVPADETTHNMINESALQQMRRGSYLINASRGTVVDIPVLAARLKDGSLGGAAVDVFPREPASLDEPFVSELVGQYKAILTPHIGGSTVEAQENIGSEVAERLVMFSDRGTTERAVNFPMVNLLPHEGAHRILHIHRNVSGILKQINKVIADADINVLGQYLATNNDIGYVVLDIAADVSERLVGMLKEIEGTLRARLLY